MSKFDVYLPIDSVETISKSDDSHNGNYLISGYASTGDEDLQHEQIDPAGIDASYLISDGWVDFEHDTDQVIGVPTKNTHVDQKGLFLEAELFKNMPQVQDIIKLYHNIKDKDIDSNLGFSVEGNVIERDEDDESIIRQVQITGVAVTKNPANTHATWELLTKSLFDVDKTNKEAKETKPLMSMTVKINKSKDVIVGGKKVASMDKKNQVDKALLAGHGITPSTQSNGAAFRTEQFSDQLVSLAQNMKQAREIGLSPIANNVADILSDKKADDETMTVFLQLFEGLSYTDAQAVVHAVKTNTLTNSRLESILGGADDITEDADDD